MNGEMEVEYERLIDPLSDEDMANYDIQASLIVQELFEYVKDDACRKLISKFLNKYRYMFLRMVGSSTHHHNYIGGLKDHTMEVVRIAITLAEKHNELYAQGIILEKYPINMDVLVTGAFFHDVGKMWSYIDTPPLKRPKGARPKKPFKRSYHTKMMNHFGEALWVLSDLITPDLRLSKKYEREIYHIIATHHGEVRSAWGDASSMLNPNTNEAWLVYLADMYSAKVL